jgi:hypothetical protein
VVATTKMVIGMLLVLVAYAITIAYIGFTWGLWYGVFATALLPLSGWATLRVLDRLRLVRRAFGVLARRFRFRGEVRRLREKRAKLSSDVIRVVSEIKPADLEMLFPPGHPDRVHESHDARHDADLDAALDKRDRRDD